MMSIKQSSGIVIQGAHCPASGINLSSVLLNLFDLSTENIKISGDAISFIIFVNINAILF